MESVLLKELNLSPVGPGMYGHCSIEAEEVNLSCNWHYFISSIISNSIISIFTTVKLITSTICIMSMAIVIIIVMQTHYDLWRFIWFIPKGWQSVC